MRNQTNLEDFVAEYDLEGDDFLLSQRYEELEEDSREISWNEMPRAWY